MMTRSAFVVLTILLICPVTFAQTQRADCPTISVTGPAGMTNPGDVMVFAAQTTAKLPVTASFNWTVSNGTIESGQGTKSISVRVPTGENGGNVTAIVKLTGLQNACFITAGETAPITYLPIGEPVDKYGQLSLFDEYARVHLGVVAARDNPTCLLVIIREAPRFGTAEKTRINKIKAFISQRLHFPSRRLRIITKVGPQVQNVIWLVPPGAKMPE